MLKSYASLVKLVGRIPDFQWEIQKLKTNKLSCKIAVIN